MSIPKKGRRTITVDEHTYRYMITGNITVDLAIESDECKGQLLTASFGHGAPVSPGLVRKTIKYGIQKGWTPMENGKVLQLGNIDGWLDVIDVE